jgi:hypothetical protein
MKHRHSGLRRNDGKIEIFLSKSHSTPAPLIFLSTRFLVAEKTLIASMPIYVNKIVKICED